MPIEGQYITTDAYMLLYEQKSLYGGMKNLRK